MARGRSHPLTAAAPALPHPEPAGSSISYGWTHWGQAGQTKARLNRLTGELEIRDGKNWIHCHPKCLAFFTRQEVAQPSLL